MEPLDIIEHISPCFVAAARVLHDITYLYENFSENFGKEEMTEIATLYGNQSSVLEEYTLAYNEDTILSISDLLEDLTKFIDLFDERNPG